VIEVAFDLVEPQRARVEYSLCLGLFGGDARLFLFEQIEGDGLCVIGLEQLLAFATKLGEPPLLPSDFLRVEISRRLGSRSMTP